MHGQIIAILAASIVHQNAKQITKTKTKYTYHIYLLLQKANVQAYIIGDTELKIMIQKSSPINKRQDRVCFDDDGDDDDDHFPSRKRMGLQTTCPQ